MKVELEKDYLIVSPETDFEIYWLQNFGKCGCLEAFHKYGMGYEDYIGIKIVSRETK